MTRRKRRVSGQEAVDQAFAAVDHAPLLDALGVHLPETALKQALTHRSIANENGNLPHNERLEFLGDAVLGLSVAGALFELHPESPESIISKMRATLVSRYGLSDIAREIHLGDHVLLGIGEESMGGRDRVSILADTMEAVFGAIYLEHGFHATRDVILRLYGDKLKTASAKGINADWKTSLQERLAERGLPMAVYETTSNGPDHQRHFVATASVQGYELGRGEGTAKKLAEQQAAHQAYLALQNTVDWEALHKDA